VTQWVAVLGDISLGEFVLLAVVAASQWYRHRSRGTAWVALAFAILGAVAVVGKVVTIWSPPTWFLPWFYKGILGVIFVLPYCFFRFASSFRTPRKWVRVTAVALTLGVLVFTAALKYLPLSGMPPPPDYLAYRLAVGCQWGFLFSFVVLRLWTAGRGQTTAAANRMRLLAAAIAGLDLQVVVGAIGLSEHATVELATQAVSVAMGILFLLALVLPSFMRSRWRKHEVDEFQAAVGDLVTVGSSEDVAARLLPHVCALVGASSAALIDGEGHVIAEYANDLAPPGAESVGNLWRDDAVSVNSRFGPGHHLVVKVSPYMPYFGRDELRRLEELGDLVGLAMDRCALAELEREAKDALTHQALHDSLTGLPNRDLFLDRITQALAVVERHTAVLAVMFIDLDRFKLINDRIDHAAGDHVLIEVANRLMSVVRGGDTVARVGGDEFVALVELEQESDAVAVAERMRETVGAPMFVGGRNLSVTASIGVVVARSDRDNPSTLLREADAAMYLAKAAGRDHVQLFSEPVRVRALELMDLENELFHAIGAGQLRLHYQPIFRLSDGVAVGVEALVRWQHPKRGLLAPDSFISLAEDSGLIVPLGDWVLTEACRQAARWAEMLPDPDPFIVWVNKSAGQFHTTDVVNTVLGTLAAAGLEPTSLGVEITESVFMSDTERLRTTMSDLKSHGVSIAIDDFGTGFSSLGYLKRFPIDILKIDRSFVQGIGREPETSLVTACLAMARSLGIRTVAEGVECLEEGTWLADSGCDDVQGFAYCPPVEADEAIEIVIATRQGATKPMSVATP